MREQTGKLLNSRGNCISQSATSLASKTALGFDFPHEEIPDTLGWERSQRVFCRLRGCQERHT